MGGPTYPAVQRLAPGESRTAAFRTYFVPGRKVEPGGLVPVLVMDGRLSPRGFFQKLVTREDSGPGITHLSIYRC